MQSTKSGVSRVPGLPTKLISVPKEYIRGYHVLTVIYSNYSKEGYTYRTYSN